MSTTAYYDPAASGSSHHHLHSSANMHRDRPTSSNSSLGEMDDADGYHARHGYSAIQSSAGRDDTYVRGQYTQRPRDYEYGGNTNRSPDVSRTHVDREGYFSHSDQYTFATSLDKTPRRVAYKKSAEDGVLSTGPIPAYQGGKGNGAETTTRDSLQRKLGQSSGLADSMAGTLLSLTVVRTFREMTTQTTEDDMNEDTVWNGVRISCLPPFSRETVPVLPVASAVETDDRHRLSTILHPLPLKTSSVEVENEHRISGHPIQVQLDPQSSRQLIVSQSLLDVVNSLPDTADSSAQARIAVLEQTPSAHEHKKEAENQQGNKQQFTQEVEMEKEKEKEKGAVSSAAEPQSFISLATPNSQSTTHSNTTPATDAPTSAVTSPKVAENDTRTSATAVTVPTTPKTAESDPWTSTAPVTVTAMATPKVAENDPWTSTAPVPVPVPTTPKTPESDPWTSTAPVTVTVTATPKVAENDPWTSAAPVPVPVPTTPKTAESDPWTSTAPVTVTVTTTPKVAENDPWTSTAPVTVTAMATPKVAENDPWTSSAPIVVAPAAKSTENDPWTSTTTVTVTTAPKTAGADPQTIATALATATTPKKVESDSLTSSTATASRIPASATTMPLFSWTATETKKGAGAMVDWSSGRVAEFPADDKPKRMPVTEPWERSYGAEHEYDPTSEKSAPQQRQDKDSGVSKEDRWVGDGASDSRGRERDRGSNRRHNTEHGTYEQGGPEDQHSARREPSSGLYQHHSTQEGKKKSSIRSTSVSSNSSSSTTSSSRASSHQLSQHQQRTVQSGSPDHRGAPQGRKSLTSAERFEASLTHNNNNNNNNYGDSQYQDSAGSAGGSYRNSAPQFDSSHGFNSYGQSNKGSGYGFNNNPDLSRPFADTQYGRAGYHSTGPGGRGSGSHNRYNPQPQQPYIQRQYGSSNATPPVFQQQQPYYQQHQQYQATFQHNQYPQSRQQPRPGYGYNNRPQTNVSKHTGRPLPSHSGGNPQGNTNVVTVSIPEGSDFAATTEAVLAKTTALDHRQPADSTGSTSMTSDYTQSSRSASPDFAFNSQRSASISSAISGMDSGAGHGSSYQSLPTAVDTHTESGATGALSKGPPELATSKNFFSLLASKGFAPSTASGSISGFKGHKKKSEYVDAEREQATTVSNEQATPATSVQNTSLDDIDGTNIAIAPASNAVASLVSIADDKALGGPPASNSSTGSDGKTDVQSIPSVG